MQVYEGAMATVTPRKTQLQTYEIQISTYDTNDTKIVMKALLNVLQDKGSIVRNADTDPGLLTASKETDIGNIDIVVVLPLLSLHPYGQNT
jgi:hypothetical protein